MTSPLDVLNAATPERARVLFTACCGASRWVERMVEARPFTSADAMLAAADAAWSTLGPSDWHEAFAQHPRIGEQCAELASSQAATWSAAEQSSVASADESARAALAEMNAAYERRFGHIYIVCAAGKRSAELLAMARERMHNSPEIELRVAAEQQRQITHRRLQTLLTEFK